MIGPMGPPRAGLIGRQSEKATMVFRFFFLALTLVLCLGLPVRADKTRDEVIRLQSDVLALQGQIRALQKNFDESIAAMRALMEQNSQQLTRLVQTLTALNETVQGERAGTRLLLDEIARDLEGLSLRFDDLNTRFSALSARVASVRVSSEKLESTPGPDQLYRTAYNDYLQGNYDLAVRGFQAYLEQFKDGDLADDAQYYSGDSLYNQRRFSDALAAFNQLLSSYPNSDRVPAARLKKGLALLEMKRRQEAIAELTELVRQFPSTQEANTARQQLENLGVRVQAPRR